MIRPATAADLAAIGCWRDIEHKLVGLKKGELEFRVSYATPATTTR